MSEFYILLKCLFISWLIVKLDPLQIAFEWIAERSGIFNTLFYGVLSCWKCLTFWTALIVFLFSIHLPMFLFIASLGAFIANGFESLGVFIANRLKN
jgi:hypothetical protein